MSEDKEKKAAALLDEERRSDDDEQEETKQQTISDAGEALRKLCRGTMKLMNPIRANGQDVTEIRFDFCGLTGEEMMDALDSAAGTPNPLTISNRQAIALFAATAGKCAPMIQNGGVQTRLYDAKDVRRRLGVADSVKAAQLAVLFYRASSQAGESNISRE